MFFEPVLAVYIIKAYTNSC